MRHKLWAAAVLAIAPFRIEFSGEGANVEGWFFNGDDKVTSTSGKFENGLLILNFDHYAAKLDATWKDGQLEGQYGPMQKKLYRFQSYRDGKSVLSHFSVSRPALLEGSG